MIVILDYGSQYSELIARRIREANVYSEVIPHTMSADEIVAKHNPKGIILSGGPATVTEADAPSCDPKIFELGIPVLGICYGMQLMSHLLGGEVVAGGNENHVGKSRREYGKAQLKIDSDSDLFDGIWSDSIVWMSHGDEVTKIPTGFQRVAYTADCQFAAMANSAKRQYGVQFHPEVVHSVKGKEMIGNFLFKVCRCEANWNAGSFIERTVRELQETIGDAKVICALSGGVDSTVASALLRKAIGNQLTCVFIDQGFMRKGEADRIRKLFTEKFDIDLIHVNATERFFKKLEGITDPEQKRKRIGEEFIRTFEEQAIILKKDYPFLAQGTLYPDVIESATVGVAKTAVKIKTHHNVGGLPEKMKFKIVEPLRMLFKDEVRRVGLELGVPEEIVYRQPFPGPGLAIRILGEVTPDRVKILQEADVIVMDEIRAAGYYYKLWQSFAVLLPVRSVGVQGDNRTYGETIAVRAVSSEDAMTANWAHLPYDLLEKISSRIMNEVSGINRVVYDISSKPPSTIEWE